MMTSLSRIRANQINAQKSTGPRTATGKARSAQNARQHGLRTPIAADPKWRSAFLAQREALTDLALQSSRPSAIDHLAHAMVELRRIMAVKSAFIDETLANLVSDQVDIVFKLLNTLETFNRYEQRAHYRLAQALEAFRPGIGKPPSRKQGLPQFRVMKPVPRSCPTPSSNISGASL